MMFRQEFQNPFHLVKLRSNAAPYHIFSFNCLHLLILPMSDSQFIVPD